MASHPGDAHGEPPQDGDPPLRPILLAGGGRIAPQDAPSAARQYDLVHTAELYVQVVDHPGSGTVRSGRLLQNPSSSWAQLDEARCCETAVEGQRLLNSPSTHHSKARRIDKRILPLIPQAQSLERLRLHPLVNMHDSDVGELLETIEETHRSCVA
jgi:hypothetical protein